jgi:hypothetical protein
LLFNYSREIEEEEVLPNTFYEANITLTPRPCKNKTQKEDSKPKSFMTKDENSP